MGTVLCGASAAVLQVFMDASFYIITGLFAAGVIDMFLDEAVITARLGGANTRSVLWASLIGVPLPLCSCSVIPVAAALRKKGASKGATLSFLISTPESGIDSFFVSLALLDPIMAFFRPLSAFITAVLAGTAENLFGNKEVAAHKPVKPDCGCCSGRENTTTPRAFSLENFKHGMRFAFIEMLGDIGLWLVGGLVIAGLISYFFPDTFILEYLGSGWKAMLLMLVIGIPMYICASASTPIAAALIAKGMSPGAALVFLLAGPATNAAGIAVVSRLMGKRTVAIYLASISISALGLGFLLDHTYIAAGINPQASMGQISHLLPAWLETASAVVLVALLSHALWKTHSATHCS
ncbi:MAG TPA: hypothetical protein DCL44_11680 [Elusimicrobia bacterium]|nr:hypothetical protein [Elusimicrobiota bacterium]